MSTFHDSTSTPDNQQAKTSPCWVYFISAGSTPIKIGLSDNPQARLHELQTAHYQPLHMLYTIRCKNRDAAREIEGAFHRWYDHLRLRLEWFDLTPQKVTDDIHLLVSLADSVIEVVSHVESDELQSLGVRAERIQVVRQRKKQIRRYRKNMVAKDIVTQHFEIYPDDLKLSAERVADRIKTLTEQSVGKSTVGDVQKVLRREYGLILDYKFTAERNEDIG